MAKTTAIAVLAKSSGWARGCAGPENMPMLVNVIDAARSLGIAPRRGQHRLLLLPILGLVLFSALAVIYIGYVLWPRWPVSASRVEAPALPITIGNVTFDVPPAAIRAAMQRRAGVQDRIDLQFLWPSLEMRIKKANAPFARVFVTISAADGGLPPRERLRTIYPRYAASEAVPLAGGLLDVSFRDGTPYQGEDLIYQDGQPEHFFVRCTRDGPAHLPGICLAQRRIDSADIIIRFPRDWLIDWRGVANGIDRLITNLRPH